MSSELRFELVLGDYHAFGPKLDRLKSAWNFKDNGYPGSRMVPIIYSPRYPAWMNLDA